MESIVNKLQRLLMINWVEDTILQLKRLGNCWADARVQVFPRRAAVMGRTGKEHSASRTISLSIRRAEVQALSEDGGLRAREPWAAPLASLVPSVCVTWTRRGLFRLWEPKAPQGVAEYAKVQALPSPPSPSAPNSVYFIWGSYLSFVWRNICCCQTVWKSPG